MNKERENQIDRLVNQEILLCQTSLVEKLLSSEIVQYEDITNTYEEDEDEEPEQKEIYEWWAVTNWFAMKLEDQGESILDTEYGTWWGRSTTGQNIKMDYVMEEIAKSIYNV